MFFFRLSLVVTGWNGLASSLGQVVPKGRLIAAPGYSAFCGCFKSKPHRSPATPHLIFIFILVDHSFQKNSEHCWLASQEGNSTKTAVHICTKKTEVWWIHFGYFWIHHGGRQTSSMAAKDTFVPRSDDQSHGKISSFHGFRGDDPQECAFWCLFPEGAGLHSQGKQQLGEAFWMFGCHKFTHECQVSQHPWNGAGKVRMRHRRLWRPQGVHYAHNTDMHIDMIWYIAYPMIGDDGSWWHRSKCFGCFHLCFNTRHHGQKT